MPKADENSKPNSDKCIEVSNQTELRKLGSRLGMNSAVEELTISFGTADHAEKSGRAPAIAHVLKKTPNLTSLTLKFSGHLHTRMDCLGDDLVHALCSLTKLEHFEHRAMTAARTDFGQYELMKLVSSWPNLRTLYLAGDTNGDEDKCNKLPEATCALESVTFERCMSNYEVLAPMFAGSANSLRTFKAWTMGFKEIDLILRPILPGLESLTLGGCNYPSVDFIVNELSTAPNLSTIALRGSSSHGTAERKALATALTKEGSFPALTTIMYPAQEGTYKTGRGRNVREHEYQNEGEKELLEAAKKRNVSAWVAHELQYKVEGAQRRAGFAALGRRGFW